MGGATGRAVSSSALLERRDEVSALERLITEACRGTGGLVLIEGEAGIGKTALLSTAAASGRDHGMRVLTARCAPMEQGFAYGAALQLLEPAVIAADPAERSALLDGAAALAQPLLSAGAFDEATLPGADASYAALHGLYWLTANLSTRQPLLLTVDDLHWIDLPSLRWLTYLARRIEELPLALALTTRSDEPPVDLGLLNELAGNPLCRLLQPRRLTADGVARLVEAGLGAADPAFSAACAAATGGNPFLLRELVHALAEDGVEPTRQAAAVVPEFGPHAVSRHVLARLSRRSVDVVQFARAGSVLGDHVELRLVARMAELDEVAAADAAADLQRIGILRSDTDETQGLVFVHGIVRTAIYQELSPSERSIWHGRAAQLLAAERAPVEQAAAHLLRTEAIDGEAAIGVLQQAARRLMARGAPEQAAACLRRALRLGPAAAERPDLLLTLGRIELRVDAAAAAEHLAEAFHAISDGRRRARTSLLLGQAYALDNRPLESIAIVQRALDALGPSDQDLAMRLEAELLYFALGELETVPLALERLFRFDPDELGQETQAERAVLAIFTIVALGVGTSQEQAVALANRALAGGLLPEAGQHWASVFVFAVAALICTERFDQAQRYLDAALEGARARGSLSVYALTAGFRSTLATRAGRIPEAVTFAEEAQEAMALTQLGIAAPYPVAFLLDAFVEQGRLDEADEVLDRTGFTGPLAHTWASNMLLHARGRLRMAQSDPGAALEDFLEAGRRQLSWGLPNPAILPWRSDAALAHLALGHTEEAARLADEEVKLARSWGARRAVGMALRAQGLVAAGAEGLALLREAAEQLELSAGRLELGRALVDIGAALNVAGEREEARARLREGLEVAQQCGGIALAQRALEELVAAGGRPRRVSHSGVGALTPSERRVAMLAAEGRTNRDIAAELFVTQRTVEIHLTHAYRKLGIPGRPQLAAALAEQRAAP